MTKVRAHRRGGSFVRRHERGPITLHLSTEDVTSPTGGYGLAAYVRAERPDYIFIDTFDPTRRGRKGETEEKTMSRLLSHETLHATLGRIEEHAASAKLDSKRGPYGSFRPLETVTASGLMRKSPRKKPRASEAP